MASTLNTAMRRLTTSQMRQIAPFARSAPSTITLRLLRAYSTDAPPPPASPPSALLSQLKTDLKTAMRAKDAPRLTVLRGVLAAVMNAAKTDRPVETDLQLVQLLRKTRRGNEEALEEARRAGRQDLVDREEAQVAVIDGYMAGSGVQVVGEPELRALVETAVAEAGGDTGKVMKALMSRDWAAEGKLVDKGLLSQIAKEMIKGKQDGA